MYTIGIKENSYKIYISINLEEEKNIIQVKTNTNKGLAEKNLESLKKMTVDTPIKNKETYNIQNLKSSIHWKLAIILYCIPMWGKLNTSNHKKRANTNNRLAKKVKDAGLIKIGIIKNW